MCIEVKAIALRLTLRATITVFDTTQNGQCNKVFNVLTFTHFQNAWP